MIIKQIDRPTLRHLRAQIEDALSVIGKEHGIVLTMGNARFTPDSFRAKIECQLQSAEKPGVSAAFTRMLKLRKLNPHRANPKGYTLIDYKPNARKNKWVIVSRQGTKYVISEATAQAWFGDK